MVSPRKIADHVARRHGLDVIDLQPGIVDRAIATKLPRARALDLVALPFRLTGRCIEIAVANPTTYPASEAARDFPGRETTILVAAKKDIVAAIEDVHREQIVVENNADYLKGLTRDLIHERASDIHVEPRDTNVRIRKRIDGLLEDHAYIAKDANNSLVQAIKTAARLSTSERRLPQDGQFTETYGSRRYTFRVSTLPCHFGEKAVIRIQDETANILTFAELGMLPDDIELYSQILQRPYGLIYHTGPTGSGKTTLMYSGLATLNARTLNITTAEEPVEYVQPDYNQVSINERISNEFTSLSFSNILRTILRQDPDVIMIGETRDLETAKISIQAALTGHLVFSTLHTNDATGTISRLGSWRDQGLEPILLANALQAAIGQRLIRRVCPDCRVPHPQAAELCEQYSLGPEATLFHANPKGCEKCRRGYRGRLGIFEIFNFEPVSAMIATGADEMAIRQELIAHHGARTMRADGLRKVALGLTTLEELLTNLL
jgi:type II secretory ATPase GspE/PulE/Tfp pilus assembly ATPase PilB-like protein